jgi:hypothetical protein
MTTRFSYIVACSSPGASTPDLKFHPTVRIACVACASTAVSETLSVSISDQPIFTASGLDTTSVRLQLAVSRCPQSGT